MKKNIKFTSTTSQLTNIIPLMFTLMLTIIIVAFSSYLKVEILKLFELIPNNKYVVDVNPSVIIYIICCIIWLRLLWKVLVTNSLYYDFEDGRIAMHFGVLNKEIDYLEYYRIKDHSIKQPLIARIAGLYNIDIISTDRTHPVLNMKYLKNFKNREPELRGFIEKSTSTGRGREIDVV